MSASARSTGSSSAWIARALRDQGMPEAEVRSLLSATDPAVVRRYLELHVERLQERLQEERDLVAAWTPVLVEAADRRGRARAPLGLSRPAASARRRAASPSSASAHPSAG